jgi:hypothetical protein
MGSGCIDSYILDLGTSLEWVVNFFARKRDHGTHWIEGLVGPGTGLDDMKKRKFLPLSGHSLRPFSRPASSQLLYQCIILGPPS